MISSWSRRLLSVVSGIVVICATATAYTTAATETETGLTDLIYYAIIQMISFNTNDT